MRNNLKIVFVIIATLVGAGFASGKEIYSFFFCYGMYGIFGIFIASTIISIVVYKVLKICSRNNISTYSEFCEIFGNTFSMSSILNNIVNIFLLITFFIMISGFSTFLKQEFNINQIIGSVIIISLCYITFLKNINGLIKISDYLIPILIIFLVYVSTKDVKFVDNYNQIFSKTQLNNYIIPAYVKSVLYACYNCIILIPILVNLSIILKSKKTNELISISVLSCIVIIILSFAIYNLLLQGNSYVFSLEMPIIEIVKKYGVYYKTIYQMMIGIAIFTTAISTGYGFLSNYSKTYKKYKINMIFMSIFALFFSQLSFSFLINLLYPVLGVIGIFEIILVIFKSKFYER